MVKGKLFFNNLAKISVVIALICNGNLFAKNFPKTIPTNTKRFNADEWRLGIGYGNSFYQGNQRNYNEITRNFGEFSEFQPSFVFEVFKQYGSQYELGLRLTHGKMQTLKSNNALGLECEFDDIQFNAQYSLNDNIDLMGSPVTFNAQAGLGAIYYKAMFFSVNGVTKTKEQVLATVGYERQYPNAAKIQENKVASVIGNVGFNIGLRLSPSIQLYWQNNFSLSLSNKMSGNLYKRSVIPPDGYLYTGILLSFKLGTGPSRYGCPKF